MGSLLIKNVDVITLDERGRVIRSTNIAIADGCIKAIGDVPSEFVADEVIDGTNHVAMPGFFNAHAHASMTLVRGWAEDLPLDRWLNERIWVAESALKEEDVYWGAALAACEMIRSGTVAFADHYFWMDRVAEVVERSGMKALLAWCIFGLGPEQEIGGITLERTVDFVQRWQGAADGRIRTILGPHSPYICPSDFLKRVAETAAKLNVGIHIHLAESQEQFDNSLARYGRTPIAYLDSLGLFDVPVIAAHCIYLTEEDMDILASKGVHVVQCPKTHMKMGMGTTPVPELLSRGVNVALGTDGPASNNDLDMLEVTRLAALSQKFGHRDPKVMSSREVLHLATRNGALAMGFEGSGVLEAGRPADLILFDFDKPHLRPRHDLMANIVHSARAGDISHVIVDGQLLLRDGELLTLDEERILYEAERRAFRIVSQKLHRVREYKA